MESNDALAARYALAQRIARAAGEWTLRYFQTDAFQVERKGDDSPVTIADRESEQLLRREIAAVFPDDAILGEELGETAGTSGYRWILDPIDGTKSFIHGVPLYTTLIGVESAGRSAIGVIYAPATDEIIHALAGQPAWYARRGEAPTRAQVSKTTSLSESLLLTSEIKTFRTNRPKDATGVYLELQNRCRLARTWGDAYGYMMVATGRAEAMIDPAMSVWDAAALLPILEAAGGTFTNWQGEATIHSGEGLGTNGAVLADVLEIIRGW